MYQGKRVAKHSAGKKLSKKSLAAIGAIALVMVAVIGGTIAFLMAQDDAIINTFTPGVVSCDVIEPPFNGNVKENVTVKNTGNTDAYIRAAIVVNWVDSTGNVYGEAPVEGTDYTISIGSAWTLKDGYYYYNASVEPNDSTANLIDSAAPFAGKEPAGYTLQITILASAVQSSPDQAVIDAWGFVPSGSN